MIDSRVATDLGTTHRIGRSLLKANDLKATARRAHTEEESQNLMVVLWCMQYKHKSRLERLEHRNSERERFTEIAPAFSRMTTLPSPTN